jgi:chloramphenicol O-acetyltransferase type A
VSYVEVEKYYRQEHFDFYRGYRCPFYGVTFSLPAAALRALAKEQGWPVYLSFCYFFTRAMQPLEDFRYRLLDGRIVLYDRVHPGLTLPASGGRFRFSYFEYQDEPEDFFADAREEWARSVEGPLLQSQAEPNAVFFTALPKVPFDSFHHAFDDPAQTEPRVAFGRFRGEGDDLRVPVGIQVNHAFIDGAALGELVEGAEVLFAQPR